MGDAPASVPLSLEKHRPQGGLLQHCWRVSRKQIRTRRTLPRACRHVDPPHSQRRQRHPAVAGFAQEPAQAVPRAGRQGHAVPADAGAHQAVAASRRADRGGQRGSPFPCRRPVAGSRHRRRHHRAGTAGAQHRAGDRARRAAGTATRSRGDPAGVAGRSSGGRYRFIRAGRGAGVAAGPAGLAGDLRHSPGPSGNRFRLHPPRRGHRRPWLPGGAFRREARPGHRRVLSRRRRLRLELRHVPVQGRALSGGTRRACTGDAGSGARGARESVFRPRLRAHRSRRVRAGAGRFDRLCGDGKNPARGGDPGQLRVERHRLVVGTVADRRQGRRRQPARRRHPDGGHAQLVVALARPPPGGHRRRRRPDRGDHAGRHPGGAP